jgi:hypothetical protein
MTKRLSILMAILVSLALVFATGRAGQKPTQARSTELLETGVFHGEEVTAQTGERWLGLHVADENSTLLSYRLIVTPAHDGVVDDEDQKTGKEVGVDLPLKPVFLVKGAAMLSGGPVSTVFERANPDQSLQKISPIKLKIAEASYELKVVGFEDGAKCYEPGLPRNAKLVLASGETTQVLYSLEECGNDPSWYLVWAGDLDRDGKLDLYVDVTQHYNVSNRKLFLSSQARNGDLVKEVAEFVTGGC